MHVRHHPSAATHVRDFRLGVARPVELGVEGGILEGEVREQPLGAHPARQPEQVVVGIARVEVDPFLYPEDLDREDRGLPATQPCLGGLQQAAHGHPRLRASVGTVVDRREWRLRSGPRVHGVEVSDEGLHRLVGLASGLFEGLTTNPLGKAIGVVDESSEQPPDLLVLGSKTSLVRFQRPFRGCFPHLVDLVLVAPKNLEDSCQTGLGGALKGLGDARCHVTIKIWHGLTTVLVILVGLDGNASQGCV